MSETISKELTKSTYRYSPPRPPDYIPGKYRYFVEGEWVEEEDMPESGRQNVLVDYLKGVWAFLFSLENCYIGANLIMYPAGNYGERVAPDMFLVKGLSLTEAEIDELKSYEVKPPLRPAPNVVIEISSDATWEVDILPKNKPLDYANLGVQEYFAYDPLGTWSKAKTKLRGWQYQNKQATEIQPDAKTGWLWSNELDSWLAQDGSYLRLYDREKKLRPTQVEAIRAVLQETKQLAEEAKRQVEEAERREEALERTIAELKAQLEKKSDL